MSYQYSIDDLAAKCNVTKQSIYKLFAKDKDFIAANSTRRGRKVRYNQAVVNYVSEYYDVPALEVKDESTPAAAEETSDAEVSRNDTASDQLINDLETRIQELEKQIAELEAQLQKIDAERVELLRQNGALILSLQTEQQTTRALLPAPRRSIGERLKGLFRKD